MKTIKIITLLLLIITSSIFATAQYPDKVLYDGKEYNLHTNPMEAYFTKYPDKKPKGGVMSTALWRGYVATFYFKENNLVLKDIEIEIWDEKEDKTTWKSVKNGIVIKGEDFLIDWFTGILVLPYGELVNYVHMGYGSTYSNYILLEVKKGKITGKRNFDYKQYENFKEKQFQEFKKTDAYNKHMTELKKENQSQEFIDSFLRNFVINYTSEFLVDEDKSTKKSNGSDKE